MGTCRPRIHMDFSSCQIICVRHFLTYIRYMMTNRNHIQMLQLYTLLLSYFHHYKGDFSGIPYSYPEFTRYGIITTPDTIVSEFNPFLVVPTTPDGATFGPSQTPEIVGIIVNSFSLLIFTHSPSKITLTKHLYFPPFKCYLQITILFHQCLGSYGYIDKTKLSRT